MAVESVEQLLAVLGIGVPQDFQDHDLRGKQLILLCVHCEEVLGHPSEIRCILSE